MELIVFVEQKNQLFMHMIGLNSNCCAYFLFFFILVVTIQIFTYLCTCMSLSWEEMYCIVMGFFQKI